MSALVFSFFLCIQKSRGGILHTPPRSTIVTAVHDRRATRVTHSYHGTSIQYVPVMEGRRRHSLGPHRQPPPAHTASGYNDRTPRPAKLLRERRQSGTALTRRRCLRCASRSRMAPAHRHAWVRWMRGRVLREKSLYRVWFRHGRRPAAKDAALSRRAQVAAHRTVARAERQAGQLLGELLLPRGAGGAARNRVEPRRVLAFGGGGPVGALAEDKDVARLGRERLARPRRRRPAAEDARVTWARSRARARRGRRRSDENAGTLGGGVARGTF